jgi:hypothetical protein
MVPVWECYAVIHQSCRIAVFFCVCRPATSNCELEASVWYGEGWQGEKADDIHSWQRKSGLW